MGLLVTMYVFYTNVNTIVADREGGLVCYW